MFSLRQTTKATSDPASPAPPGEQEALATNVEIATPSPSVDRPVGDHAVPANTVVTLDHVVTVESLKSADAVDADTAKPEARLTHAKAVEGSARSADGATSPWLMLPAQRNYRLYVPPHVAPRNGGDTLPLVVMVHGCRETAEEFERGTRMNTIADREGFAVLYPDQASFANIRRCWNWFEANTAAGNGECAIILEMIREARKHAKLDPTRVYVAGMSSGAAIAGLLAYHHPDTFAAVAMHSGLPPMMPPSASAAISAMKKGVRVNGDLLAQMYWNTHNVLPPPLIVLHGDQDETVTERNATSMVKLWEKLYETAPQANPLQRVETEIASAENARSYSQIDQQRDGRTVISGLRIHGLAHLWSGGDASLPFNDAKGPVASELIWKFFEGQQRVRLS